MRKLRLGYKVLIVWALLALLIFLPQALSERGMTEDSVALPIFLAVLFYILWRFLANREILECKACDARMTRKQFKKSLYIASEDIAFQLEMMEDEHHQNRDRPLFLHLIFPWKRTAYQRYLSRHQGKQCSSCGVGLRGSLVETGEKAGWVWAAINAIDRKIPSARDQ